MSKFSGKCDFCDVISIRGLDYILNSNVYLGSSTTPLPLNSVEDCIPYYPHIVTVAAYDNVNRCGIIRLTAKSWVDIEEERYGHMNCHDYYRDELQKEMKSHGLDRW